MSTPSPDALEIADLTVRFGTATAVDAASLSVPRGSAFGLVGESGSGKSTILRAIAGLVGGWQGTIRLNGQPLTRRREAAFFRQVQMVFQDPYASLHPRHTVDRCLSEPLILHRIGDVERRVETALEQVGLGPAFRFRYPHQLSGGQRQRVAIARALMLEPAVLLLDEPTSALDVSVQAEVLNLLSDLRRARGLTYLLVSHDLAVVAHMCDRLAVMREGRIVETLEVAQLRENRATDPYTQSLIAASLGPVQREEA
ncbi:MAG: ABC transporter ATP-binding protein [Pseudomonadota bacterium]